MNFSKNIAQTLFNIKSDYRNSDLGYDMFYMLDINGYDMAQKNNKILHDPQYMCRDIDVVDDILNGSFLLSKCLWAMSVHIVFNKP